MLAPPYDVVGPAERAELAERSEFNAIHLELPEPDPSAGLDRYEHAARLLSEWTAAGVLEQRTRPRCYLYRMRYVDELGNPRATTGVLAALGLDPGETGEVLPHEQIIAKDMQDRLSLLRACRANLSPIWGLSLAAGLSEWCAAAVEAAGPSPWAATEDGVVHECWPVEDGDDLARLGAIAAGAPVLIADGHHRYATACAYAAEARAANGDRPGSHDFVLAFVVELTADELSIRPIHRLLRGVEGASLLDALGADFEVGPAPGGPEALTDAMARAGSLALVTAQGTHLLRPTAALEARSDDDLDSSLLRAALDRIGPVELTYQAGWRTATAAVADGRADAAVLLNPVTIEQIERVAHGGLRMQPKSTYFYPKPRTGMAFRSLD